MKKVKTFRIDENLEREIVKISKQFGITTSQFIELSLYHFLEEKPEYATAKRIENRRIQEGKNFTTIQISTDNATYKKLIEEVKRNNVTLSQEIRYRLSASLWDEKIIHYKDIDSLINFRNDLNRLGRLFKLALASGKLFATDKEIMDIRLKIMDCEKEIIKLANDTWEKVL
ncbi:hypothetical protein A6A19_00255 [Actinobacillus delphinicola]|uniref:hypothetical protein n=1 Tax=Actinobacillus delphinicola TaxID=51161 RepID=UPI0024424DA2|nr:hypothetical protein [Actinobacillus delphinicola]MDG6896477.1 hypothetical protein [Actinobacillus delphinicola]